MWGGCKNVRIDKTDFANLDNARFGTDHAKT